VKKEFQLAEQRGEDPMNPKLVMNRSMMTAVSLPITSLRDNHNDHSNKSHDRDDYHHVDHDRRHYRDRNSGYKSSGVHRYIRGELGRSPNMQRYGNRQRGIDHKVDEEIAEYDVPKRIGVCHLLFLHL